MKAIELFWWHVFFVRKKEWRHTLPLLWSNFGIYVNIIWATNPVSSQSGRHFADDILKGMEIGEFRFISYWIGAPGD